MTELAKLCIDKVLLSNSMIQTFQGCRKQFEYIYKRGIYPATTSDSLMFGGLVHKLLEIWFNAIKYHQEHKGSSWFDMHAEFERKCSETLDAEVLLSAEDRCKARVMMKKYVELYASDVSDFKVEAVEWEFAEPLVSPDGKDESKSFCLGGKIDGLVRSKQDGKLYILEHKTARSCNDGYIDRVSIDFQTALYAMAVEEAMGEKVAGVIYDVLVKSGLEMKQGETDEEFEARKAAAKQPGRIKRKEVETEAEFEIRLSENITGKNFIRVAVDFDDEQRLELSEEIWAIASDIENCTCFYKCTGNCLKYGVCPFMSLCKAHGEVSRLSQEDMATFKIGSSLHPELSADLTSRFKEIF